MSELPFTTVFQSFYC